MSVIWVGRRYYKLGGDGEPKGKPLPMQGKGESLPMQGEGEASSTMDMGG